MSLVGNLSLRAKLFSGFGAVLALTAIMGVVLLSQVSSVYSGGKSIGNKALPSVHAIDTIGATVASLNGAADAYPEFPTKIQKLITGLELGDEAQVDKLLHTYSTS